ncbi:hypothetical protein NC653_031340 [Populus alba x Populus x berolinensis]|uniref:Uncharacterized protein n=1 Tax=Populus alba x Populus x berolinensis TaxID=444605 RepID=A0AAD6LY77_9ROSI|nr:hypothetical protein NC653_031340 [Populus alba x Populus x berolinensis]
MKEKIGEVVRQCEVGCWFKGVMWVWSVGNNQVEGLVEVEKGKGRLMRGRTTGGLAERGEFW